MSSRPNPSSVIFVPCVLRRSCGVPVRHRGQDRSRASSRRAVRSDGDPPTRKYEPSRSVQPTSPAQSLATTRVRRPFLVPGQPFDGSGAPGISHQPVDDVLAPCAARHRVADRAVGLISVRRPAIPPFECIPKQRQFISDNTRSRDPPRYVRRPAWIDVHPQFFLIAHVKIADVAARV